MTGVIKCFTLVCFVGDFFLRILPWQLHIKPAFGRIFEHFFRPPNKQIQVNRPYITQILRVRGIPLKKKVIRRSEPEQRRGVFYVIAHSAFPLKPKTKKQCKTRFYIALISLSIKRR